MKIDSIAGIGNMVENKGVNAHKGKTTFSEVLKDSIQKAGELEKKLIRRQ